MNKRSYIFITGIIAITIGDNKIFCYFKKYLFKYLNNYKPKKIVKHFNHFSSFEYFKMNLKNNLFQYLDSEVNYLLFSSHEKGFDYKLSKLKKYLKDNKYLVEEMDINKISDSTQNTSNIIKKIKKNYPCILLEITRNNKL